MRQRLPGVRNNKISHKNGSFKYIIPKDAACELDLEDGEVPEDVEIDREKRELTLCFE